MVTATRHNTIAHTQHACDSATRHNTIAHCEASGSGSGSQDGVYAAVLRIVARAARIAADERALHAADVGLSTALRSRGVCAIDCVGWIVAKDRL